MNASIHRPAKVAATRPRFITFTGVDDSCDVSQLRILQRDYPVEFGVLFAPNRTGAARYPSYGFARSLDGAGLRLSAHVCGAFSRQLAEDGRIPALEPILATGMFSRIQVNIADGLAAPDRIREFARDFGMRAILQSRHPVEFPHCLAVDWLYDTSGGRGEAPAAWPSRGADPDRLVGYAGGVNPANVASVVAQVGATAGDYWIDMESGVRLVSSSTDRFSLELCREVCAAVFPAEEYGGAPDSGLYLLTPAILDACAAEHS